MEQADIIDILESIIADLEAGRLVTAAERIKRLAVMLDRQGLGKSLHLIQQGR